MFKFDSPDNKNFSEEKSIVRNPDDNKDNKIFLEDLFKGESKNDLHEADPGDFKDENDHPSREKDGFFKYKEESSEIKFPGLNDKILDEEFKINELMDDLKTYFEDITEESADNSENEDSADENTDDSENEEKNDVNTDKLKEGNLYNDVNGSPRRPENNGKWSGEAGNSKWIPDGDYIPPEKSKNPDKPYSNPDNLTWKEILNKYGIAGVSFKNGFPDFSEISKGTVEIDGFETGGNTEKNRNFKKADIELAKQKNCSPEDVKKWREENNYTWHECEDKKTMQKVPNEVHANVPHDGGRSQKD